MAAADDNPALRALLTELTAERFCPKAAPPPPPPLPEDHAERRRLLCAAFGDTDDYPTGAEIIPLSAALLERRSVAPHPPTVQDSRFSVTPHESPRLTGEATG